MAKIKFDKRFLKDELELPYTALEERIIGHTRWSVIYEIIFEHEGKFYRTTYSTGATEQQDESPWEYEDEVVCEEVHKVSRMVEVWEPVPEDQA